MAWSPPWYPVAPGDVVDESHPNDTVAKVSALDDLVEVLRFPPIVAQTADYTLVLTDAGKVVEVDSGSARTVTVPPNASVAFPVGTIVEVCQVGAGTVTVAAGSGVTVRQAGALAGQWATVSLRKRATNEWVLTGELA